MAIAHPTRTDEAYIFIRSKIIEGEILFGSRLHITNLAEETGFSNTPIREALVRLEMFGLAKSIAHKGVFVVSPDAIQVREMIQGRLCLEVFMARDVLRKVTSADIAKMREVCLHAASVKPSVRLSFEEGLHGYYAHIAGNQFLEHLYQRVMVLLNVLYIQGLRNCDDETWIRHHRETHHAEEMLIIDGIEAGDISLVEERVAEHVSKFGDFLLKTLERWTPVGLNWDT